MAGNRAGGRQAEVVASTSDDSVLAPLCGELPRIEKLFCMGTGSLDRLHPRHFSVASDDRAFEPLQLGVQKRRWTPRKRTPVCLAGRGSPRCSSSLPCRRSLVRIHRKESAETHGESQEAGLAP